ncbi:PREDICTED: GDSL esterase/lipase At1g29660-like isoform X2 [Tarenaya hassleriana]|uniref:GDSL esterase/lipase At1g29660-like isoform X2 n=1 Tax=Tarenaya hassleriana TaxID=28532 RepID=UPI00053C3D21|nr:PREDICTED: GDSL esterase/lipase At1g29660-like isoform X2 [Tarenaya hassleriana]
MEGYYKKRHVVFVGLILELMLCFRAKGEPPQVPCYFIFGDSLVDNGNNNRLPSLARADYFPYGIDFPQGPTGRFSNGKTAVDVMAEILGFDHYIPPYSDAVGEELLDGVNYASAAAGIREETGQQLGDRISFRQQVQNHRRLVSRVVNILGGEEMAANHLSRCIYSIGLGGNDYLNNYFMPLSYPFSRLYTPDQFADDLIDIYSKQLCLLYRYGARKFVLNGVGPVGCTPAELAGSSPDGRTCIGRINSAIRIFNRKLTSLVDRINGNLPGVTSIYTNSYGILLDILYNPSSYE